jgi:hypothetical protein
MTTTTAYTTGPVTLDGWVTVLAVYDPSERWNGWLAAPRMDALSVVTVLTALNGQYTDADAAVYGHDWTFNADGSLTVVERQWTHEYPNEPNHGETIPADADGLYTLGAYGWVWSEDDDPTTSDTDARPVVPGDTVTIVPDGAGYAANLGTVWRVEDTGMDRSRGDGWRAVVRLSVVGRPAYGRTSYVTDVQRVTA